MKTTIKLLFLCLLLNASLIAQTQANPNPLPGTPCANCYQNTPPPPSNPKGGNSNNSVMNGNGSLATTYTQSACGLNYIQVSVRLNKRAFGFTPATGVTQPAPFVVTGLPPCAVIQVAFLYGGGGGPTGTGNFNATIVDPANVSSTHAMSQIGFHTDKCWSYGGTWTSRANVTSAIIGNGTYSISGFPVMPQSPSKDTDGATLFIVYADPTQNYTGSVVLADGCFVGVGGAIDNVISGFNVCGPPSNVQHFMAVGDLQQISAPNLRFNSLANNGTYAIASQQVWDFITFAGAPPTVGQTTANYGITSSGDCYSLNMAGMYFRTACLTCTLPNSPTISSATICAGNSATLVANGPQSFTWSPAGSLNTPFGATVVANPAATTVYSVSYYYAPNCIKTETTLVTVNATPTITSVSNTGPVCQGTPVSFSVNSTGGGVTTYLWNGPGGFNSNVQNPQIPSPNPANSGAYSVTVTNTFTNGGVCQASGLTNLGVVPIAPVVVTPNYTLCQGTTLNLNANAPGATSYAWSGPSAFNSNLQNPSLTNVLPASSGNFTATAFYTSSSTTLICTSTAVSNVSIVATSPVTVTMPNNLCQNSTANMIASAPGAVAYSWSGPNNFTSNSAITSIPNVQPNNTGNYFVTATFAIGTVSCTTGGSNQLSIVPVNPIIVTPTVNICEPSNATLNSNSTGAATYSWSGPNSYSAQTANTTLFFPTPAASGIYTVSTTYNNGSFTCYNSNTVQLTVNPRITFTLEPFKRLCYNDILTVNGPGGATTYTWTGSSGFNSNTQNLFIPSIQPNQSGTYTLDVQLGPCITSQKMQVEVLTPLAFTLTPHDQTICRGDSVTLIAGSTGGSGNYAYVWTPGVFLGSPTGSVQYGHPVGTTVYNLAGYDIACPHYTVVHSFIVTVKQPPKPDLILEKNQGCQPLCLFYNTKTQNESAVTTFDFGNSLIIQSDSFNYCLDQPGVYNLKITSRGINGCIGVYDYGVPITVWPKPQSDFGWNPDVVTTSNNQVVFDPTHKYGPITSMNWMFSGTGIDGYDTSNVEHPQRVFETPGRYPIMLIQRTDMGCADTVVKFLDIIEDFNVYIPNAFTPNGDGNNEVFNIKGLGLKSTGYSMEIFDRWGHIMYSTKDYTKGWDGTVKGQPAQDGVYIYKIYAVGANGEGKKEYIGHVTLMK